MGLLKKIFKPVSKVLDKVIPNEIKPALPYLAAFAPMFGPTSAMMGQGIMRRALISGALNIGGQLAQEGSEGDINLLSAGLGALTGAMTAPGAAETFRGAQSANVLQDANVKRTALQKATDFGLEGLAKGSDIFAAGMADPFSKAGLKAATLPAATATGDLMQAEARQLEKQAAIDAALSEAAALGDDANRALALRTAMEAYGFFTDEEIEDTIASAGYADGGAVGIMKAKRGFVDEPGGYAGEYITKKNKYITKKKKFDLSDLDSLKDDDEDEDEDNDGIEWIKRKDSSGSNKWIQKKAEGGLMNLGGKEMDLRKGGFVPIGKKERADDVPARLSKNEFVMTADAVRAAGGGSVNKGAKRMYNLMNTLEARA